MRTFQIIVLTLLALTNVGCQMWDAPREIAPPAPPPPTFACPPGTMPAYIYPSVPGPPQQGPIYAAPGSNVVLPPGSAVPPFPGATHIPAPPVGVAEPGWFDVLPTDARAISTDLGLPAAPVIENPLPNPLIIPIGNGAVANGELAWDRLVDVVTDYFPVRREQPVQLAGGVLTDGYIETPFQTGATIFEPQRNDSVGPYNRWQSTLQSIRRRAIINVQPTAGGWAIGVNVQKQLEDLARPEEGLASAAVLRSDMSLPNTRDRQALLLEDSPFWIDLGRDEPLEQEMLREIRERLVGPSR